jgi:hypothetical protein
MRRLNVRPAQIDECIQNSRFALSFRPKNPELKKGELLLLQLVKADATKMGKVRERINFALVFDRIEPDLDGQLSRLYWPAEQRVWPWIIHCSMTIPTVPFSLENLPLLASDKYQGQDNARYIDPQDEQWILPFIRWSLGEAPAPYLDSVPTSKIVRKFGQPNTLAAIYNHDRIARQKSVAKKQTIVEEFIRNEWLATTLKVYYEHRCQICGKSFLPDYGVDLADTHHIHYLAQGGPDVSSNILVVCPNHHRVIHATDAFFNRNNLSYEYPNGFQERLLIPDHFLYEGQLGYNV